MCICVCVCVCMCVYVCVCVFSASPQHSDTQVPTRDTDIDNTQSPTTPVQYAISPTNNNQTQQQQPNLTRSPLSPLSSPPQPNTHSPLEEDLPTTRYLFVPSTSAKANTYPYATRKSTAQTQKNQWKLFQERKRQLKHQREMLETQYRHIVVNHKYTHARRRRAQSGKLRLPYYLRNVKSKLKAQFDHDKRMQYEAKVERKAVIAQYIRRGNQREAKRYEKVQRSLPPFVHVPVATSVRAVISGASDVVWFVWL